MRASIAAGRILVVEDHAETLRLFHDALVDAGFDVVTASNGAEALRLLRGTTPDAIVLDLMLPWISGVEVLATLRTDPRLVTVPVVVATGSATSDADLRGFRPIVVLRKPFDIDTLVPAIQQLMDQEPV